MEKGTRLSSIFDYPEAAKSHDSRIIGTRLYQERLKETYKVKERAGELEEEWGLIEESFVGHASNVCGKGFVGGCMRGSEWWNEGVKMKVEEKKMAFEEWLQSNSMETYE